MNLKKSLNITLFMVGLGLSLTACIQNPKEQDYDPMQVGSSESAAEPVTEPIQSPPTVSIPPSDANLEAQLDTGTPTADVFEKTPPTTISAEESTPDPQVEPPVPKKSVPKIKTIKAEVKFKLQKKSAAKAQVVDDGKSVHVTFTATKAKKGLYTIMAESSCKKKAKDKKVKPVVVAQFQIKKGDKYTSTEKAKGISLRSDSKSIAKRSLVLYHGPKAKVRLACTPMKI